MKERQYLQIRPIWTITLIAVLVECLVPGITLAAAPTQTDLGLTADQISSPIAFINFVLPIVVGALSLCLIIWTALTVGQKSVVGFKDWLKTGDISELAGPAGMGALLIIAEIVLAITLVKYATPAA